MFSEYGLQSQLIAALKSGKIDSPTPVQSKVIPALLSDADVQVSAETGSGKTLAYLLPLMHKMMQPTSNRTGSRALILLPTRELAQQTFKECSRLAGFTKTKAVLVIGGQESRYQASLMRRDPDIIVATPGRLIEHLDKGSAVLEDIEILVLDEADRMLDMGFREDVLDIVSRCNTERQSILLSATLSHRGVTHVAQQVLKEPQIFNIANAQTKHDNIVQKTVLSDDSEHKKKQLLWLLSQDNFNKAIVFANKRIHVAELCAWLRAKQVKANELHGEIPQDERKHVMSMFSQGRFNVLVATDVAARGLDIDGVDLVINFDMAHSGDEYVHRIGRTGRAGNQGTAISLITDHEWNLSAGIQRYLRQTFETMTIPGLTGKYKGPKKLKSSGKAVGSKTKNKSTGKPQGKGKGKTKTSAKKKIKVKEKAKEQQVSPETPAKVRHRDRKNIGKRRPTAGSAERVPDSVKTGMAPPKRKPTTSSKTAKDEQ